VPQYRVGAHVYVFSQYGFDQVGQFEEIVETVSRAGFEAVELMDPMLEQPGYKERIDAALEANGLALVGASHGYQLWDPAQEEQIIAEGTRRAERLSVWEGMKAGTSCSGKRYADRTDQENAQAVKMWTKLGEIFTERGVRLNYHTHGEPVEDVRLVTDNVPPEVLALGPDLDWLRVGGIDPYEFCREFGDRLDMLHIRDYHLGGDRTEALGEGDADYARLDALLREIGFTGDFVVELAIPAGHEPTRPVNELLKASVDHLKATIGYQPPREKA